METIGSTFARLNRAFDTVGKRLGQDPRVFKFTFLLNTIFLLAAISAGFAAGQISMLKKNNLLSTQTAVPPFMVILFWVAVIFLGFTQVHRIKDGPTAYAVATAVRKNYLLFAAIMVMAGYLGSR